MRSSKVFVIGLSVLIMGVLAGLTWVMLHQSQPEDQTTSQPDISLTPVVNTAPWGGCMTTYVLYGVHSETGGDALTIEYPCDWDITAAGNNMFRVANADGTASFAWPITDMATAGMTFVSDTTQMLQGVSYPAHVYSENAMSARFIDIPIANEYHDSGLVVTYSREAEKAIVDEILSRLSF